MKRPNMIVYGLATIDLRSSFAVNADSSLRMFTISYLCKQLQCGHGFFRGLFWRLQQSGQKFHDFTGDAIDLGDSGTDDEPDF